MKFEFLSTPILLTLILLAVVIFLIIFGQEIMINAVAIVKQ